MPDDRRARAPLAQLRVLDLATLYAAPLLSTFLADHGAEVVKVEPPTGDVYRSWPAMWALVGRGKRSLALDLTEAEGRRLLTRLVPSFDVVVESFPARLAERWGLNPESLRQLKPSLVVVSATGFGRDGPYADRPANGTIGEAFAGLTHLTGEAEGAPWLPSVPLGDALAAAFGAMGALAAVVRQVQTGEGGHVDVTVFEPVLHALGPTLPGFKPGAAAPGRDGGAMGIALRGTFPTADGAWVAISCSTPRHEQSVAGLVGAPPSEPLRAAAAAWIARHPRDEVVEALASARVPVSAVNDLADIAADPHIQARRSLGTADGQTVAVPTPRIDGATTLSGSSPLGNANDEFLRGALGLGDAELKKLARQGIIP